MNLLVAVPGTGAPKPRGWRTAVGVLTLALALGCTAPPIASGAGVLPEGAPALPAATLDVETTIPAATMRAQQTVVAGTGSYLVRRLTGAYEVQSYEYSKDQGVSWQPLPAGVTSPQYLVGAGGRFLSLTEGEHHRVEDSDSYAVTGLQLWDPATGAISNHPVDLGVANEDEKAEILDFTGSRALVRGAEGPPDGADLGVQEIDLSSGSAVTQAMAFRAWPDGSAGGGARLLTSDGGYAVAWRHKDDSTTGYLAVAPTSTRLGGVPVTVAGLLDVDVAGSSIHTLIGSSTSLRSCVSAVTSPGTRSCKTVASGDYRRLRTTSSGAQYLKGSMYRIAVVGAARLIGRYDGQGTAKLVEKGVVTSFAQGSWASQTWLGFRDTVRPLLDRVSGSAGSYLYRVTTSPSLQLAFRAPWVPAKVNDLSLASGLVAGIDSRGGTLDTRTVWQQRLVGGAALSPQVLKVRNGGYGRLTLGASAGRVVAQFDGSTSFYDLGSLKYTRTVAGFVDQVSGPFALNQGTVRRWDWATFGAARAIYGSLAVTRESDTTLRVRDVADPTWAPLTVSAPSGAWSGVALRGDWVAIGSYSQEAIVVTNFRTGQTLSIPDEVLVAVGDGFVLTTRAIYSLPTLARLALPADAILATTDGVSRVAWVNTADASISVAAVAGAGTDAPRMLGVVAKSTFVATGTSKFVSAVDVDKGVNPGALEIRNSAGVLVRTLASAGTRRGALRGSLTWDGRNSAGSLVPAGTYRLTLVATALDGTGPVTGIDGEGAATWTVKLSR